MSQQDAAKQQANTRNNIRDRIEKFLDVKTLFESGEMDYFFEKPKVDEKILVWKEDSLENAKRHISAISERLSALGEDVWEYGRIKELVMPYADAEGRGNVLWPMRVALSGREKSPDPFEIASILGKEETLKRL
jgi:glutamyl/glutaminyl-tRNA synthetase